MTSLSSAARSSSPLSSAPALAGLLALGMAGAVGGALAFEHIGGFVPCALCLQQRTPYYIGIPVAVAAFAAATLRAPVAVTRGLFLVAAALMLYGGGLGAYHSGVEWGWWEGPAGCGGGAVTTDAGSLLSSLNATRPPSCNEAAGRLFGLSFAGWNVIASLGLAAIALKGAFTRPR
jgi:disulfide bond formation protein DsbB